MRFVIKCKIEGKNAQKSNLAIHYSDESVKKTLLILCEYDSINQGVGNVTENDSEVNVSYREEHIRQ